MAKNDFGQVSSNNLEVLESPLTVLSGMSPAFTVLVSGSGTIDTPTMKLYKGSKDVTSTNTTGSMSVSGRAITCKQITTLSTGDWVFYIYFNDGGVPSERFCRFYVPREGV